MVFSLGRRRIYPSGRSRSWSDQVAGCKWYLPSVGARRPWQQRI